MDHKRASVIIPALVILIGFALRFHMLTLDRRFHPDEALFAAQARLISQQGDLLLRETDLDKPPLTFWIAALSFRTLGATEFAARLPNVLFSGLSLALFYRLAQRLYADRVTAALAVLLLALSPYDLAFAATVFTDIQATFWILAACALAVDDRWVWAGITAALIFASKSNALIFLPLIITLGIARNAEPGWNSRNLLARLGYFVLPLVAGIGLLVLWDVARAPRSFLSLGYTRNNPGRFIRSNELWPRLIRWVHWLTFVMGSSVLSGFLPLAGIVAILKNRAAVYDWLIGGFSMAFLVWHWLIAFNTYDRYIHSLTPFLLLLAARVLVGLSRMIPVQIIVLTAIGLMLPALIVTLQGEAAIAGDQGERTGIDTLAEYLNDQLAGESVYDHWLGWELSYYLGPSPKVFVLYSPLPEALADDVVNQTGISYFAAPSSRHAAPWIAELQRVGVGVSVIYRTHDFVVYQLE